MVTGKETRICDETDSKLMRRMVMIIMMKMMKIIMAMMTMMKIIMLMIYQKSRDPREQFWRTTRLYSKTSR